MAGGFMAEITLNKNELKELLKEAIFEILQEERQIFSELFADALEDIALAKAIAEGKDTEPVSREAIFKILDGVNES